jgi:hypothetical protein
MNANTIIQQALDISIRQIGRHYSRLEPKVAGLRSPEPGTSPIKRAPQDSPDAVELPRLTCHSQRHRYPLGRRAAGFSRLLRTPARDPGRHDRTGPGIGYTQPPYHGWALWQPHHQGPADVSPVIPLTAGRIVGAALVGSSSAATVLRWQGRADYIHRLARDLQFDGTCGCFVYASGNYRLYAAKRRGLAHAAVLTPRMIVPMSVIVSRLSTALTTWSICSSVITFVALLRNFAASSSVVIMVPGSGEGVPCG